MDQFPYQQPHFPKFEARNEGYFTEHRGALNLASLREDLTADILLRAAHRNGDDLETGVLYVWDGIETLWVPAVPVLQSRLLVALGGRWREQLEKTALGYLLRHADDLLLPEPGWVPFANVVVSDADPHTWTPRMPHEVDEADESWNYQYTGDWTATIPHKFLVPGMPGVPENWNEYVAFIKAGTAATDRFLSQVLPADAQDFAWEMIGYFLTQRRIDRKAIMLRGEGANGKSRLLQLLINLLGDKNVSHLPLAAINKTSSPELGALRDKLANIVDDMGTRVGSDISNFKTAVTGGKITVNPKWQHPYAFEPRAKFAFAVNRIPVSPDTSAAWGTRWIIVPFDATFTREQQRPAEHIDQELLAEADFIVTRAMWHLAKLVKRDEFDIPPSFDQAEEEFEEASNPVIAWITDGGATLDPKGRVKGVELLGAFQRSAHGQAYRHLTARAFYEMLRGVEGVERRTSTGNYQWVYGLTLPSPEAADLAARLYESS